MARKRKSPSINEFQNMSYESLWLGDFDKDGTPNIDDRFPFNKNKKGEVNPEITLSNAYKGLINLQKNYKTDIQKLAKDLGAKLFRVKETYSIINKVMLNAGKNLGDIGGLMIVVPDRKALRKKVAEIKKKYRKNILSTSDKYRIASATGSPYRAYHFDLLVDGKRYELQVKTEPMKKLSERMHTVYKLNQKNKEKLARALKPFKAESDKLFAKGF